MRNFKFFFIALVLSFNILFSGCVPVLIGLGVATGYMVTKDAVSGNFDIGYDTLWNTAVYVLERKGEIVSNDKQSGVLKANVGKDVVVVKIRELTEASQNLRVSARKKGIISNLSKAEEVFSEIVRKLTKNKEQEN